jgi:hypothetical protein
MLAGHVRHACENVTLSTLFESLESTMLSGFSQPQSELTEPSGVQFRAKTTREE